jgi:regulator of RNase E activity RraA
MSDRSDALAARLLNCYAAAVHDVLRGMGYGRCVLPPHIRALDPTKKLAGEVYTVGGHIDLTRDPHDTLVQWTGLLSKAPPGKVVVCQPNTYDIALMGELSAETLNCGIRGYVGMAAAATPISFWAGFPVFCNNTPKDIVGRQCRTASEPITIGSHDQPDYLLADRDGVDIQARWLTTSQPTEAVLQTENTVRTAFSRHGSTGSVSR